jgi:hypothetical protein
MTHGVSCVIPAYTDLKRIDLTFKRESRSILRMPKKYIHSSSKVVLIRDKPRTQVIIGLNK